MPLDRESHEILAHIRARETVPFHALTPEAARSLPRLPLELGPDLYRVEERTVPGVEGEIPLRVYTPRKGGPFPVLVWFFGGGWVLGSLDMADATCRKLALQADCVVVSVEYRRAPEAKFPAAAEDSYAATRWVAENATQINGQAHRIAVGGESSGGNLAAAVALMARDRDAPSLVFQLLVCPVMARDFSWPSYSQLGDDTRPSIELMDWFWGHYLNHEADAYNPYAAPLEAADVKHLPPALIITAEFDSLRDEGAAYAKRLEQAGVPTEYRCYPGTIHLFFLLADRIKKGRQAIAESVSALRSAFDVA